MNFMFILFIQVCFAFWNKNSAKYDKWSFELWINLDKSTNLCTEYWSIKKTRKKETTKYSVYSSKWESILLLESLNKKNKEKKRERTAHTYGD